MHGLGSVEANYIAGTPYVGADVKMYAGPGGHMGEFTAWDPKEGREVWTLKERFPLWQGEQRTGIVRNAQGLNPDTLHDGRRHGEAVHGGAAAHAA